MTTTPQNPSIQPPKRPKTGGRKRAILDSARVEQLAALGLSVNEISTLTAIPEMLLTRKFRTLLARKKAEIKERLLQRQWDLANSTGGGALGASIWLGKNLAGQTDRADVTSAGGTLRVVVERIGGK